MESECHKLENIQRRTQIGLHEKLLDDLKKQRDDLNRELEAMLAASTDRWTSRLDDLQELRVAPRRSDVIFDAWGLVWAPYWELETGEGSVLRAPAYAGRSGGPLPGR